MKQVLNVVATLLMRAARSRAELVMQAQAKAGAQATEDYRANAGGWN